MPTRIELILKKIPEKQRKDAAARIQKAVAMGWEEKFIDLRTPDGFDNDQMWLMGTHPVSQEITNLPDLEDYNDA